MEIFVLLLKTKKGKQKEIKTNKKNERKNKERIREKTKNE